MLAEEDLRRLYAKINAHEVMLRVAIRILANLADDPAHALEQMRTAAMECGDVLDRKKDDPNPEFTDLGRVETLEYLAESFRYISGLKAGG